MGGAAWWPDPTLTGHLPQYSEQCLYGEVWEECTATMNTTIMIIEFIFHIMIRIKLNIRTVGRELYQYVAVSVLSLLRVCTISLEAVDCGILLNSAHLQTRWEVQSCTNWSS